LGLGLALVQHIVSAHGGTVSASSEGEDLGSTFCVSLPCNVAVPSVELESTSTGVTVTPSPPFSLTNVNVLLVEEDDDARELFGAILARHGAAVQKAAGCTDALRCLAQSMPNVLLTDIGRLNHDGYELIYRIRAAGFSARVLPAIALTTHATREDEQRLLNAGFQLCVAKPVERAELAALVVLVAEVARISPDPRSLN
jgi:CheY-like chemotaxis protein